MSNFERNLPSHVKTVRDQIAAKYREIYAIDWGHDCDCEYCDRYGEEPDPDADLKEQELKQDIAALKKLERGLTLHGKRHGVGIEL